MPTTTDKKEVIAAEGVKAPSKIWLWSALTIAGALVVLFVSVTAYIMNAYKFIYPNVYADNIRLGGLSTQQAEQAVTQHIREKLANFSVTAEANGASHIFTPDNINADYNAGTTAQDAYGVGRTGNVFQRMGDIFMAYFSRVDIEVTPKLDAGADIITQQIAAMAAQIDIEVRQYSYKINDRDIAITNAVSGRRLNQTSASDDVLLRFENLEPGVISFEAEEVVPEPLDIAKLRNLIYKEPKSAYLDTTDEAKIMAHQTGVDFDPDALKEALKTDKPEIIVPLIFTEPEITQTMLQESLFRDELSTFTTYLSASNVPRTGNIRLSANYINGTIIVPGEVFSFNETVGQRTAARGFQEAGAYVNGRLVPELGGGICQMSTTTYNTVLLANLGVVERNNHSMTVAYVPTGRDAMVNWGTSDLKFENTTGYPIQILAEQASNYVKVTIMGTKTREFTVEIERKTLSSNPQNRIENVNSALAPGTSKVVQDGHDGYVIETYRVVKDGDGNVISREFEAKSSYRKVDHIVEVGPAAVAPPVTQPSAPPTTPPTETTSPPPVTPDPTPDPTPPPSTPEPPGEIVDHPEWSA